MAKENFFPFLEVPGRVDHHGFGQALGEFSRPAILEAIEVRRQKIGDQYPQALEQTIPYAQQIKHHLPQVDNVITGIYDSLSGHQDITRHDLNLVYLFEIFDPSEPEKFPPPERCTLFVSPNRNGSLYAGTEDWNEEGAIDKLYIIKATIQEGRTRPVTILGPAYLSELPGSASLINSEGLVQGVTYQPTDRVGQGISRIALACATMESRNLDQAVDTIKSHRPTPGFNFVFVQGHEARNVEISRGQIAVESIIRAPFVRTNHYTLPETKIEQDIPPSEKSEVRYTRGWEIVRSNMTVKDLQIAVSDKKHPRYPILNHTTIASFVFDPPNRTIYIRRNPQPDAEFMTYSL